MSASDSDSESDSSEPVDIAIYSPIHPRQMSVDEHTFAEEIEIATTGTIYRTGSHEATRSKSHITIDDLPTDQRIIMQLIKFVILLIIVTSGIIATLLATWLLCTSIQELCRTTAHVQEIVTNISVYFFASSLGMEAVCIVVFLSSASLHRCRFGRMVPGRSMLNLTPLTPSLSESHQQKYATKILT